MKTTGLNSLREELETQTSLDEDLEEQERQRWIEDGKQMWRQGLGKRHLPDDFSDPAPHLTDLEKHRKRVRSDFMGKESEDQRSWSQHGDRLSFGSYGGGQNIPASASNEAIGQQRPNVSTVQAREVVKQRRTRVPTVRGGHLEATSLSEDQKTTNVRKVEKGTKLIRTPGVLTVKQAEIFARLATMGRRPEFIAPPAPASQPASKNPGFRSVGYQYTGRGDKIQPFPIKRSMKGDPILSADGLVHPWAAKPHEKVGTAAGSASMSQMQGAKTGDTSERGRVARGGAATRGKGGMVRVGGSTRGRATTRGGGEARGGCQTALPQQAPPGQIRRSSNPQGPSTLPMHGPSVPRGQNSHHVHFQMGEMERPPIERVQQTSGPMNGHVHSNGISQGRPSGFMPITSSATPPYAIPGNQLGGPPQQRPNPVQRQADVTISSRGPTPGTSYTFPSLEGGLITAEDGGPRGPFPIQAQQSPVVVSISKSRMALPPSLFPYGQGRHGEYNSQTSMSPSADKDPQHSLPTPPQRPAMGLPRTTSQLAECGPQQPLLSPCQRPAMPPSAESGPQHQLPTPPLQPQLLPCLATAPAPWPWVEPHHREGREARQMVVPPLVEEEEGGASRMSVPAQRSQLAVPGTAVIGFGLAQDKLS